MVLGVRIPRILARACAGALLGALAAGCSLGGASQSLAVSHETCPETVLSTLGKVVARVYREGVDSERTIVARQLITRSLPLREAVQRRDPAAAEAAARALVAGGKLSALIVTVDGRTLARVGSPSLAPFGGSLPGGPGAPAASYLTSVWSDSGFVTESAGIAEGAIALRVGGRDLPGSSTLLPGGLPALGAVTVAGRRYQYVSVAGTVFPAGAAVRIYLARSASSIAPYCGASATDTTVNTLRHIARLIYAGEAGRRTVPLIRRVQRYRPLLLAVARNEPAAAESAIKEILNHHIVRIRVYARPTLAASGGAAGARASQQPQPLADVGGPYVLAPVTAPLTLEGRRIGSLVLSIQDDEGYLRLTRRLVGLRVLMYMGAKLVKNSLGGDPENVPQAGPYTYGGHEYRVFTLHAKAFPSGPLRIDVFVPVPYA